MNISFFTNNYKPFVGGVPIAIENLAMTLRHRGHRVFIFAPEYNDACEDERDVFRSWSIKNFNDSNFCLPLPLSLETYMQFSDTDSQVVHCHHPFLLGATGLSAARAADVPVVFTYHTQYEKYAHYLPFDREMVIELAQSVATRFANCCDAVIAPSSDIKRVLEERGVNVPVSVIPTGVDLTKFRGGNAEWLRNKYSIPEDHRILLFISRLAKEKNVEFLLEAFARMANRTKASFVIGGTGDAQDDLKKMATELGIGQNVIFTGVLTGQDLISAYKAADLFVFSSTTETQGMVVLEAMAAGAPVVAIDACGVRDVVQDGVNGFLNEEGDLDGFVENAWRVLSDSSLQSEMRNQAFERARQLSLNSTTRQVEDLYRFVCRHPHPERAERFLLLKEVVRYHFERLTQSLATFTS